MVPTVVHRYIVNNEHNNRENRQSQPAVCYDLIDLIRGGKLAGALLLIAALDDGSDIDIALVGDDTLRIIVHLFLCCLDIVFNMSQRLP